MDILKRRPLGLQNLFPHNIPPVYIRNPLRTGQYPPKSSTRLIRSAPIDMSVYLTLSNPDGRIPNLRLLMKILAALPLHLSLVASKKGMLFAHITTLQPCVKYAWLKYNIYKQKISRIILLAFSRNQSGFVTYRTASARYLFAVLSETVSFSCRIFSNKGRLKRLNSWSSKQPVWRLFLPVFEVVALIKLTSAVCGFVFFPYLSFSFKTRQKMTLLAGCSQAPSSLGAGFLFLLSSRDERL